MSEDFSIYTTELMASFDPVAVQAAKDHAAREFPRESCGFIVAGVYVACENVASDPLQHFEIRDIDYLAARARGPIQAVVHSHPNGPIFPSENDMRHQMAVGAPYVIIPLNEDRVSDPVIWGDTLPVAPLVGRPFVHGVFDCYSLVRDYYCVTHDIVLPQVPRDDEWWTKGEDLYQDHLSKTGFRKIAREEARAGDGFLIALGDVQRANPHKRLNHAGIVLEGGIILHHLPNRLSRREVAGLWGRAVDVWVRHEGVAHA